MNIKIIFCCLVTTGILCACTSLNLSRSSQTYAVIYEDPLVPSSMAYIDALANSHCNKYDSTATFNNKDWSLMGPNIYYYNCVKKMPNAQDMTLNSFNANTSPRSIDETKKKCSDLGFKVGTEGFGKCVLQLSK